MLSDIKNSIKAKLYDFTYTPFMSSVIISWIIINHKYLLIYFSEYKLDGKLTLLKDYDFSKNIPYTEVAIPYAMNFVFPLLFGLFYVFIYPKISKVFYEYTLEKNKELKEIKQEVIDKTPITQEEAKEIREDISRLTIERDKYQKIAIEAEVKYKKQYEQEQQLLKAPISGSHKNSSEEDNEKSVLLKRLSKTARILLKETSLDTQGVALYNHFLEGSVLQTNNKTLLEAKNENPRVVAKWEASLVKLVEEGLFTEIGNKGEQFKITNLGFEFADMIEDRFQKEIVKEDLDLDSREDDITKVLRYFYESNYTTKGKASLLTNIVKTTNIARPKVEKIIDQLISDKILSNDNGKYEFIKITNFGNDSLIKKFDNENLDN